MKITLKNYKLGHHTVSIPLTKLKLDTYDDFIINYWRSYHQLKDNL